MGIDYDIKLNKKEDYKVTHTMILTMENYKISRKKKMKGNTQY